MCIFHCDVARLSQRIFVRPHSGSVDPSTFEITRQEPAASPSHRNTISAGDSGLVFGEDGTVQHIRGGNSLSSSAGADVSRSAPSSPPTAHHGRQRPSEGGGGVTRPSPLVRAATLHVASGDRRGSAPGAMSEARSGAPSMRRLALEQQAAAASTAHLALSPRGSPQATASAAVADDAHVIPPPRIGALFQVRVLYDFTAKDANEVSVRVGEICDVAFDVMRDQGWLEVVKEDDQRGLIPVGYCEVLSAPVAVPVDDLICAQDDEEISASDLSNVRAFRDGARDSATISAPTLYEDEFDYDSIDHPSDRPAERLRNGHSSSSPPSPRGSVDAAAGSAGPQIGAPQGPATVGLVDSNGGPRFSDDDLTRMRGSAGGAGGGKAAAGKSDAPLSPRSELLRKRAHVVREIYETERKYVGDLHLVCHNFLKLISKSGILKEVDIDAIFRNISSIYELHKEILHNLEECVAAGLGKGGPFPAANASLASVFINLSAYLKLYTAYCVPEDHQILTNRGFMDLETYKARAAADKQLLVAGYDARTRQLVYERGVLREFAAHTRRMVELVNDADGVSLQVTDDHDLFVQTDSSSSSTVAAAAFSKRAAKDVLGDTALDVVRQLAGAEGGFAPSADSVAAELFAPQNSAEFELFCEVYGVWLACGSLRGVDSLRVRFARGDDAALTEWLAAAMKTLGVAWADADGTVLDARWNQLFAREYGHKYVNRSDGNDDDADADDALVGSEAIVHDSNGCAFDREASDGGSYLLPERGDAKWCASWVWALGKAAARRVLDGLRRGGALRATTRSARFRDELVRLAMHAGFAARFEADGGAWRVVLSDELATTVSKARGGVRAAEYSGRVWCFTMPSGFIWTRRVLETRARDGAVLAASRAVLTGNCTHQERSRDLLLARTKQYKALDKLIKEVEATEPARSLTLETFLMTPVQRICKYPLLVRELIKMTDADHPDYEKLPAAFKVIEQAAEHVNEQKRVDFSIRRMAYIDKNLSGRPSKFQLALPTRRFMMEGELLRIGNGTRQLRRVFLFSDVLIFAKQKGKDKFQFHGMVALVKGSTFVELVSARIEPNAFQIIKADNNNIFAATSGAVRLQWLQHLATILGDGHVRMQEPEMTSMRIERVEPGSLTASTATLGSSPPTSSPGSSFRMESPMLSGELPPSASPARKPSLVRSGSNVAAHVALAPANGAPPAERGQSSNALVMRTPSFDNGPNALVADDDDNADDEPPPPPEDDDPMSALAALASRE